MKRFGIGSVFSLQATPRTREMAEAFHELSCLLVAGVSLSDALDDLTALAASRGNQRVWKGIAQRVKSGQTLSDAFGDMMCQADRAVVALVRAGEANGQLGQGCQAAHEHLQWHQDLRQRFITLLVYPLFTLVSLLGVSAFLFVSVVPSVKGFLMGSSAKLEWHTLALMSVSDWISQHYARALLLTLLIVAAFLVLLLASERMRWAGDWCVVHFPLIGRLQIELSLSRYCLVAARLYASGVSVESALALAEGSVGSRFVRSELSSARERMLGGMSLADALRDVPILPGMFVRLIAVGEHAGQLADALIRLGEWQKNTAEASIKRIEQLIGPVMLMFLGSILLWIVVSVLGPVYELAIQTVAAS